MYNKIAIRFDPLKSERNGRERGLPFDLVHAFDWDTAWFNYDLRKDYGEVRIIAIGYIGTRLHVIIFSPKEDHIRVISLRKANMKEQMRYGKETQITH